MKKILITGYNGFIGKNLTATLDQIPGFEILKFGSKNAIEQLREFTSKADFVLHLAGVNRPNDPADFETGNTGFTKQLLDMLAETGKMVPVVMSSSTQVGLENPYGISKKAAEEAVFKYGRETGAAIYVYRFPNVFGKWCRPNYNSVVATWCYNISRDIPIHVNNPNAELNFAYIDDVVKELINVLKGCEKQGTDGFYSINKTFRITLKELADILYYFKDSRKTLQMANFDGELQRLLYTTYLSYLPHEDFGYELEMKHDDRGWLAEFIKSKNLGQIFISRTKPGITRGNHWHHTKVEKFLVIEGDAVINFREISGHNITEYKVSGKNLRVLDIPPGYTHSITNIGETDVITLFWASEIYNPEKPDTYFLEVELFGKVKGNDNYRYSPRDNKTFRMY